jgi:hypothetical protein
MGNLDSDKFFAALTAPAAKVAETKKAAPTHFNPHTRHQV